jgi:hypothetical protein
MPFFFGLERLFCDGLRTLVDVDIQDDAKVSCNKSVERLQKRS